MSSWAVFPLRRRCFVCYYRISRIDTDVMLLSCYVPRWCVSLYDD
jgi:hypothetical protein